MIKEGIHDLHSVEQTAGASDCLHKFAYDNDWERKREHTSIKTSELLNLSLYTEPWDIIELLDSANKYKALFDEYVNLSKKLDEEARPVLKKYNPDGLYIR